MTLPGIYDASLLFGAGLLAGMMNAVAGGGTFVTLPAMIAAGVPAVPANASSTFALCPGSLASAWAYRNDFIPFSGVPIRVMLAVSLTGGVLGALLLLLTPGATFEHLVPWLLLFGTLTFAFGKQGSAILRRYVEIGPRTLVALQLLLGIYGGYFGGAVGIMMMATWSLLGHNDLKALNAAKTLLAGSMNFTAVVCFVVAGQIYWPQAAVMLVASVLGGYLGAHYVGRRANPQYLRAGITVLCFGITTMFFLKMR